MQLRRIRLLWESSNLSCARRPEVVLQLLLVYSLPFWVLLIRSQIGLRTASDRSSCTLFTMVTFGLTVSVCPASCNRRRGSIQLEAPFQQEHRDWKLCPPRSYQFAFCARKAWKIISLVYWRWVSDHHCALANLKLWLHHCILWLCGPTVPMTSSGQCESTCWWFLSNGIQVWSTPWIIGNLAPRFFFCSPRMADWDYPLLRPVGHDLRLPSFWRVVACRH